MIVVTSLPVKGYKATDILAVYRLRWQIELAFKRLKSLLHMDKLPTRTEKTSRSWLYAHLIVALYPMTSARISWTLPPEELFDAAYIPSFWAVWKMALLVLIAAVVGPVSINDLILAGAEIHRALANAPRKRKPAVKYPVRGLF